MPATKTRRRASRLDRDRILEAATVVARKEGTSALTMVRVADELGARDASLYYHIRNRADLIQGIVDRAGESVLHPEQCDAPETEIENIMLALYDCLRSEAWLVPHLIQGEMVSKSIEPLDARALQAFHNMGLSKALSVHAFRALLHYTFGEVQVVDAGLSGNATGSRETKHPSDPVIVEFYSALQVEQSEFRDLYRTTLRRYLTAIRMEAT